MTTSTTRIVLSISSFAAILLAGCGAQEEGEALDPGQESAVVEGGPFDVAFVDDLTVTGGGGAAAVTGFGIAFINTGAAPLGLPDLRITTVGDDHPTAACDFGLSETPSLSLAPAAAAWTPSDLGMPLLDPLVAEPLDGGGPRMFVLVEGLGDADAVTCRARLEIAGRSAAIEVTVRHQAAAGAVTLRYAHARRVSAGTPAAQPGE